MNKKILFIVEKDVINGNSYFGSSNDLLLIFEALRQEKEVYLITPNEFIESQKDGAKKEIPAHKLSKINLQNIENLYKEALFKEAINAITALPANPQNDYSDSEKESFKQLKSKSKILFENMIDEKINLKSMPVFNRAEPVSLDDKFYDLLINLEEKGVFITPNPVFTKKMGDKGSVYSIHHNKQIEGKNLADELPEKYLEQGKNKISFDSSIIKISTDQLSAQQILEFYEKLNQFLKIGNIDDLKNLFVDKSEAEKKLFDAELEKFSEGVKQYVKFHNELNNQSIKGSVAKPANYFGGCGIVLVKEKTISFFQAMKNICQVFAGIKEDCEKNGYENRASLSSIIIQERATEAHLGDLRIVIASGELQGIIVRVNPHFEKSGASNMHHGGHPESLFKHYELSFKGVDKMILDMKNSGLNETSEEIKRAEALYKLLETIDVIGKIPSLKQYAIIGADALLHKQIDGNYRYGINELNLTSPMGQTQLMAINLGVQNNKIAGEILIENGLIKDANLKPYQTLSDYFKTLDDNDSKRARDCLLKNEHLKNTIEECMVKQLSEQNPATKTLKVLFEQYLK